MERNQRPITVQVLRTTLANNFAGAVRDAHRDQRPALRRPACPQRAAPPAFQPLLVDETMRSISPFTFKDV